jgi:hypothetical protein
VRISVSPTKVSQIYNQQSCTGFPTTVSIVAVMQDDSGGPVAGQFTYTMPGNSPEGPFRMGFGGTVSGSFSAPEWGTVTQSGGTISITVTGTDLAGNVAAVSTKVTLDYCFIVG